MKKRLLTALATGLILTVSGLSLSGPAQADQVKVPVMSQGGERSDYTLPRTGQSQQTVRRHFGEPSGSRGPVGQPPITQWHYDSFVVYFEYDHVIHTVLKPGT